MSNFQSMEDIAALASPIGESALAVIRTSGEGSIERLANCFSRPEGLRRAKGNTIVYGWLRNGERRVDEVTLGVFRAPQSYTGEDSVEIYCHGSLPGIEKIMRLLFSHGFRQAEAGEFSLRAFLNGKMDLTRAEAVHELVHARSHHAQGLALGRLEGRIFEEIDRIKSIILGLMAAVSVQLDYPDDELPDETPDSPGHIVSRGDLDAAMAGLRRLSESYRAGRLYQEGVRVALYGRTNAGKSSLFNFFLKEDRAIVSEFHGTTRDYLEVPVNLDGIPLRLFDTAGLRDVAELIEREGIRRSDRVMQNSSIILYLVDSSNVNELDKAFDDKQLQRIQELGSPCIRVWTKIDLPESAPAPRGFFPLSVHSGEGFGKLQQAMKEILFSGIDQLSESDLLIDSLRQKHLIDSALRSLEQVIGGIASEQPLDLIALDLQGSLQSLGEITGEVSSEDILAQVFSSFCVGK